MKKKEALLLLVQTWVLKDQHFTPVRANSAVAGIIALNDESVIPDDIEDACEEFCLWQRNTDLKVQCPKWYNVERSEHGAHYPFPWAK